MIIEDPSIRIGEELKRFKLGGTLIGADIAENRLREARQKRIYSLCVEANVYALPFADQSFDVVVSNGMVGLTGARSVREMYRLVKPGGYLACVAVEVKNWQWSRLRFKKVCAELRLLPASSFIFRRDLGTGYADTDYNDEHHMFFLFKKNRTQCLRQKNRPNN